MIDWQPIETVPTGRRVLFGHFHIRNNEIGDCLWIGSGELEYDSLDRTVHWLDFTDHEFSTVGYHQVTHWAEINLPQPLPDAPPSKGAGMHDGGGDGTN